MQPLSFHVIGDIERRALFDDIERRAIAFQLTLTGTESLYLFAILVVDVIPVFRCFNMADALATDTHDREQQDDYGEYNLHFGSLKIYHLTISSIALRLLGFTSSAA